MKRILINDYGGYAFITQISRELATRDYEVLHLYAGHNTTPKGLLTKNSKDVGSFSIKPLYTREPLDKYSLFHRLIQEREYGKLLVAEMNDFCPDLVISADNPLDTQLTLLRNCRKNNVKTIYWLQDLIGIATKRILQKKIPLFGSIIGSYYIWLERRLLRQSNQIIVISPDFLPIISHMNVDSSKISIIPNWAPISNINVLSKENSWAQKHQLVNKFCFLYSGTLGYKHPPNIFIQLAKKYTSDATVRIVIISEGPGAQWLRKQKKEENLDNLLIFDYQPFECYQDVLATGDVLLSVLEEDAALYSVPSKVLSYLCAQRPILLAINHNNLAARIVNNNRAGCVVKVNDHRAFLDAADNLKNDPLLRNEYALNGRKYAETNFDIKSIGNVFNKIIDEM